MKVPKELPIVLIDSREQSPLPIASFPSERAGLATGDYTVAGLENHLTIERNSVPDLISTLFQKDNRTRFMREVERMLAARVRVLLIVGDAGPMPPRAIIEGHHYRSTVQPHTVFASIAALEAKGLTLRWADSPAHAALIVESLAWYSWREALQRVGLTPTKTPPAILESLTNSV
jgi:ERCC4-type nuclease